MVINVRTAVLVALGVSALALGGAMASEHLLGLVPCELCLWQRQPYAVIILLGSLAILIPRFARGAVVLAAVAGVVSVGLALTHVGVEQGWWPSPLPACSAQPLGEGSIAERLARMPARPAKPCDAPAYLLPAVPVSMAALNLLVASALTGVLVAGARRSTV